MKKVKQIIDAGIASAGGPYSYAVKYGDLVFVSGAPPFPDHYAAAVAAARRAGQPVPPFPEMSFEDQTKLVLDNLKKVLEAAGSSLDNVLKVGVWLRDQTTMEKFDRVYKLYFDKPEIWPARTRIQAGRMPMDVGLEVEAVAYVDEE